jgi:hypothetical protein
MNTITKKLCALILLASVLTIVACKGGSKKMLNSGENIEATDFIAFFDDLKLPLNLTDSIFAKKQKDSSLIDAAIFKKFTSDTLFTTDFGKEKLKTYAVGKFANGEEETYLLVKAISASKQILYALALDKNQQFSASMPLLKSAYAKGAEQIIIDGKYNFTHNLTTKLKDGETDIESQVYAYNNAGLFMVILTDGVGNLNEQPIINPIETLPRKSKYATNYAKDKRNIVCIRDGATPDKIKFFIHIEKSVTRFCDGELKGEAKMIGTDSASYTGIGEPCALGFKFKNGTVEVTESNCGNKHGMECSFDGKYGKPKAELTEKEKEKEKAKEKEKEKEKQQEKEKKTTEKTKKDTSANK